MKLIYSILCLTLSLLLPPAGISSETSLPPGLVLNLDFKNTKDGLIPSNSLFPLDVPLGSLQIVRLKERAALKIHQEEQLEIPGSSLLDPNGDGWDVSLRVRPASNGIIFTQANKRRSYCIFIEEGIPCASIHNGLTTATLRPAPSTGITNCINQWVTIQLTFREEQTLLSINRIRCDLLETSNPMIGTNYQAYIGAPPYKEPKIGFSGEISALKILRTPNANRFPSSK